MHLLGGVPGTQYETRLSELLFRLFYDKIRTWLGLLVSSSQTFLITSLREAFVGWTSSSPMTTAWSI